MANNRIKELREKKGLSQTELAKASKVPYQSILCLEHGRRDLHKCSYDSVVALSKALGCRPSNLFETEASKKL